MALPTGERPRLFFALWPGAGARRALAALAGTTAERRAGHPVAPEDLHVTLAFLGGVAPGDLAAVRAAGAAAARQVAPFTIRLDRPGGPGHGGIAWLEGPLTAPLASLQAALQAALESHGIAIDDRRFRPHVTLARHCRQPPDHADADEAAQVTWPVHELALVESRRSGSGPRYATAGRYRLGSRPPPRLTGSPAAPRRTPASRRRG